MAAISNACGDLRERVSVLKLEQTERGYIWQVDHRVWANVQPDSGTNLFSKAGTGAPGVTMVLRLREIQKGAMLLWRGQYVYVTDVQPMGRGHLQLRGAVVTVSQCAANVHKDSTGIQFPAVLTEKYVRHEQLDPYAVNVLTYVLVTPPEIKLTRGGLVTVDGENYEVLLAHVLDTSKVEYEIMRKKDL